MFILMTVKFYLKRHIFILFLLIASFIQIVISTGYLTNTKLNIIKDSGPRGVYQPMGITGVMFYTGGSPSVCIMVRGLVFIEYQTFEKEFLLLDSTIK